MSCGHSKIRIRLHACNCGVWQPLHRPFVPTEKYKEEAVARSDFRNGFFSGVGAGFALGVGAFAALQAFRPGRSPRVLRIQKSIQIGAPVSEVFGAWVDLARLPERISTIKSVVRTGDRFRWEIELAGQIFAWDAVVTQFIPQQALGWKSLSGPKHSGRITFSPLQHDTLLHVQMNYAPPLGRASAMMAEQLADYVEHSLHEFKASLEKPIELPATGTYGTQRTRFGGMAPVDFTEPTQPGPFSKPEVLK
jgi:uncharacterized membrane protein